ncbi:alpha/beta hydrolase [Bacillaceae bacterium SIJ1]|uniref:alpha/beta fold hydrolase n=1 Tax=Litoribacterium kuwaitense TaxID=1398745 RepID=UPI0013EB0288|nr:alpha/beta hydrolase [Litoribacterium kuwaitense]NGP44778.1 alpha/beta hydrolase [Litoribacterium kuwaitense]
MQHQVFTTTVDNHTIEYSIVGAGEPILAFHGGHSNCLETFGYEALVEQGYQIITPSRMGYRGSSKPASNSLAETISLYRRLLIQLHIDQVHILGISAGGPSAILFAANYPTLTQSLLLESAVTGEWLTRKHLLFYIAQGMFRSPIEKWVWSLNARFFQWFPKLMFPMMATSFTTLSRVEVKRQTLPDDLFKMKEMIDRQRSFHGFMIDLKQTKEVTTKDLKRVQCPTLLLYSPHDGAVSPAHSTYAGEHIPKATCQPVHTWGHLLWLGKGSEQTDQYALAFLQQYPIRKRNT